MANKLVTLGLIAGGGYLAYNSGLLSAFGIGTSHAAAPATPAPNPNAIQGANTLDGVYARMVAAAPSGTHSVDEWDVYLMNVVGGFTAPDPMPLFTAAVPGFDRSQKITAAQYWAVMAPWMKSNAGLSGLGPRGLGWMCAGGGR